MKLVLNIFSLLIVNVLFAQDFESDLKLINNKPLLNNKDIHYYKREGNNQAVMQTHQHSFIAKFNPITLALQSSMYLYQNVISPQLSKTCAYQITCSNFSKQAIKKFGIIKGVFLTADRLMRCNRISILDVNPINIDESTGTIIDPLSNY